jgi:hypothetical protein
MINEGSKVKIIKCSYEDWWHSKYVGQVVEVEEWSEDAYFVKEVEEHGSVLPRKDCEEVGAWPKEKDG